MFIHRSGDPSSPAVVLVHGIPGSSASWRAVAQRLSPTHDVLVPDLLGFGKSPRSSSMLADDQAAALGEALQRAGVDRAAVVGHDFGGPVALSLYRLRPELFSSLTLSATNTFPDTPIPLPLRAVTWPLVGDAFARALFSAPALRAMMRRYGGRELGDPASVRRIFTTALQRLEELYAAYPEVLASVSVPALVLWGDRDPFFPLDQAQRTAQALGEAELRILRGAGHFLAEERPEEVARAIQAVAGQAFAAS